MKRRSFLRGLAAAPFVAVAGVAESRPVVTAIDREAGVITTGYTITPGTWTFAPLGAALKEAIPDRRVDEIAYGEALTYFVNHSEPLPWEK